MSRSIPELHVTPEIGVLEAPAGCVFVDNAVHVFHQFRPKAGRGSRWAHQVASHLPYAWDIRDDVLRPEGDEIDVLAGAAVTVDEEVQLFFVTSHPRTDSAEETGVTDGAGSAERAGVGGERSDTPELLGSHIAPNRRGQRSFQIHRARIADIAALTTVSDDPEHIDPGVERLGPIDIDDAAYPIGDLVTPSVIPHPQAQPGWLMLALNLTDDTAAEIVVLHSDDLQHWVVAGPLQIHGDAKLPAGRVFSPRIVSVPDQADGQSRDVLFLTYSVAADPGSGNQPTREVSGYVVGNLHGCVFTAETEFTTLDYGHDLTRPRVVHGEHPVLLGLVGSHPHSDDEWANCLSTPRVLSLNEGVLYQDVVGAPRAVSSLSNYAQVWTGYVEPAEGKVTVQVTDDQQQEVARVEYTATQIAVVRADGQVRNAPLRDHESHTLTILLDGPLLEVFACGGAVVLTSSIMAAGQVRELAVRTGGGAKILTSMNTVGQQLQRDRAGLNNPDEQEKLIAEATQADREVAAGLIEDLELDLDVTF